MKYKNVFYFSHINIIGGIETFFYEMVIKYHNTHDITIFYKTGDEKQIQRLKKYVRVKKYMNQVIQCEKMFFNFNIEIIDNVIADEYIQILHGDYKSMGVTPNTHEKIIKYIAVSDLVKDSFKEITSKESKMLYNPYTKKEAKRVLILVSATRLTKDKGKDRMVKLGEELNKANISYLWLVFTNDKQAINNPNIVYMEPRLDVLNYIKKADYLVQLSDAEGFGYSIIEALSVGTPIISTKIKVLDELGVNENNSILLDFDMSNLDVNKIYTKEFNFKYEPPQSKWEKELIKGKSNYMEELNMKYKIKANHLWEEMKIRAKELNKIPKENDEWEIKSLERLEELQGENPYRKNFVKSFKEEKKNEDSKQKNK